MIHIENPVQHSDFEELTMKYIQWNIYNDMDLNDWQWNALALFELFCDVGICTGVNHWMIDNELKACVKVSNEMKV